ncbi:MAG: hypothetical protein KF716_24835 [Anaerolineae bacterium]|nr:hypothetical protein [Anaerolineae bacterium]
MITITTSDLILVFALYGVVVWLPGLIANIAFIQYARKVTGGTNPLAFRSIFLYAMLVVNWLLPIVIFVLLLIRANASTDASSIYELR